MDRDHILNELKAERDRLNNAIDALEGAQLRETADGSPKLPACRESAVVVP